MSLKRYQQPSLKVGDAFRLADGVNAKAAKLLHAEPCETVTLGSRDDRESLGVESSRPCEIQVPVPRYLVRVQYIFVLVVVGVGVLVWSVLVLVFGACVCVCRAPPCVL